MSDIEIKEFNPHLRAIETESHRDNIPPDRLEEFMNLIRTIVASIFTGHSLPPGIEFDDLMGFGYEGLVKAWRNYKNDKGTLFKTYATYRIRGEILDYIRKEWKARNPNYLRKLDREKIEERMFDMARATLDEMTSATDEERDAALQLSISNTAVVYLLSLESVENLSDALQRADIGDEIMGRLERSNERVSLFDAMSELDEHERRVIKMCYYENKSQVDIAKILNLSKSKVNRLHMRILGKLKHKVASKMNKKWAL